MPPKRARRPQGQPDHSKPSTSAQNPRDDGEQLQSRVDAVEKTKSKKKKTTKKRKSTKNPTTRRPNDSDFSVVPSTSHPSTKKGKSRRSTGVRNSNVRIIEADEERIKNLRENRKKKMKEDISKMPRNQIEDLLFRTIERRPGMVFDLMEQTGEQIDDGGAAPPAPDPEVPWCTCGHCKEMPTDVEKLCCGKEPHECLSQNAVFQLITDEACLLLQRAMWVDAYNLEGEPEEPGQENRSMRHAGYRSYVFWQHGRLGQGNRKVIPSCCVSTIRRMYPSVTGMYTGYIPGRFV